MVTTAILLSLTRLPTAAEGKMVVDMSKMTCSELTKLGFQDFAGKSTRRLRGQKQPRQHLVTIWP